MLQSDEEPGLCDLRRVASRRDGVSQGQGGAKEAQRKTRVYPTALSDEYDNILKENT